MIINPFGSKKIRRAALIGVGLAAAVAIASTISSRKSNNKKPVKKK